MLFNRYRPDFTDFLKELKKKKDLLRQVDLAEYLGISQSVISRILSYNLPNLERQIERINKLNKLDVKNLAHYIKKEFS